MKRTRVIAALAASVVAPGQSQEPYPLSIGLFRASSEHDRVDGRLLAVSAIVDVAPSALLHVVARKHLLRSSPGGAVRG